MTFGNDTFYLGITNNKGMEDAEESFNMGMFFYLRHPSKWVHFQTPNTHIRAFLYWGRPPRPQAHLSMQLFFLCDHQHFGLIDTDGHLTLFKKNTLDPHSWVPQFTISKGINTFSKIIDTCVTLSTVLTALDRHFIYHTLYLYLTIIIDNARMHARTHPHPPTHI